MSQKIFALKDALDSLTIKEISAWSDDDVIVLMETIRIVAQKTADLPLPLTFGCTKEELDLIKQRKHVIAIKEIRTRTGMGVADAKILADNAKSKLKPEDFVNPPDLIKPTQFISDDGRHSKA